MVLTAAQRAQIASAYERAASDENVPRQARAAFVKKASWFRMLVQIATAKERAVGSSARVASREDENLPQVPLNFRGQTFAEMLNQAHSIGFLNPTR